MEQLVLILIIALISFINWLFKKSAEAREKRKLERQTFEGGETLQRAGEIKPGARESQDPDDSMRRLMEALGLPLEEAPPPIPRRAPASPPLPPIPALPNAAPVARPAAASAARASRATPPAPKPAKPAKPGLTPLRELLASPEGLKKAVMISEILGMPKSLRS